MKLAKSQICILPVTPPIIIIASYHAIFAFLQFSKCKLWFLYKVVNFCTFQILAEVVVQIFVFEKKDCLVLGHCILSQNIRNFWRTLYVNEVNCVEFIFVCTSLRSWPIVAKVPLHRQEPVLWKSAHISYLKLYSYVEWGLFGQVSFYHKISELILSSYYCRIN